MAYEKQTWECGETITAEKLNHIENGIADASSGSGGTLRVNVDRVDESSVTHYDRTWQEVHDALERGDYVSFLRKLNDGSMYNLRIVSAQSSSGQYGVLAEDIHQGSLGVETPIKTFFHVMSSPDEYLTSGGTM